MDSLSQIVLGAACGEAVLGKKIKNKALLWGAAGGTIPDLDVLLSPFFDPVDALFVHRGFSHSLTFPFLISPLLGWLLFRLYRNAGASWKEWTYLFFWSIITHPLLDAMTGYGTGLLEPFSSYRVDISSIFIVDPMYTLPFLFFLLGVIRAKNNLEKRKNRNRLGLVLSSAYLLFTFLNQQFMEAGFRKELKAKNVSAGRMMTIPTPFNTFLWGTVAETSKGYFVGYRSWFDKSPTEFAFFPKNDSLISFCRNDERVQKLIRFSKGFYTISQRDGKMYFNDVRFAQAGGWTDLTADFVFSFEIMKKSGNSVEIRKGEWRSSRLSGLETLWERIKGI